MGPEKVKAIGSALNRVGFGVAQATLSLLFPPLCPGCDVHVAQNGVICPHCWNKLQFISRPFCPVMGIPFPYDAGEGLLSTQALYDPPPFSAARSVLIHDGLSQRLVSRLKYGNHTELAPWMARWMKRAAEDLFTKDMLIIPVPLHRLRFWQRGYNQSAELARALAAMTQLTFHPEILLRKKYTRQQVGLNAKARQDNVRAAFLVPAAMQSRIHARSILLVDDVFTTGATVRAAAKTLREAGAADVNVITFSRALKS